MDPFLLGSLVFAALVLFDLFAVRFGVDTRDSFADDAGR